MSIAVVLGFTAGAVALDAFAILLALVFAFDRARPRGAVQTTAVVTHLVLVAAVVVVGMLLQWRPAALWIAVVAVLWLLVTFCAPVVLLVTGQTTGQGAATGFLFATAAFSLVFGFAVGAIGSVAGPGPDLRALASSALGLLVAGFVALVLGGLLLNLPDRDPEPPRARPAPSPAHAPAAGTDSARSGPPPAPPAPSRPEVYTNAAVHRAMARTPCSACRSTGYGVETYVLGSPHSWYLGRCPRCGHGRDFEFRTDD